MNPSVSTGTKTSWYRWPTISWIVLVAGLLRSQAATAFVIGWGANDARQIEPPYSLTNSANAAGYVAAGFAHALALRLDGSVVAWGDNSAGQTNVPAAATNITAIAAGFRHTLALRSDGSVIGWGENLYGQLTPPASATNIIAIAGGGTHSLGLRSNGTVVAWGGNTSGQANVPVSLTGVKVIAAGAFHSLALRTNGTVAAWGYNGNGQTSVPIGLTNVIAIASGFNHSLALRSNGTVVAWGYNGQGQASIPAGLSNVVAVAAGLSHSLALRPDGSLVAWGTGPGASAIPEGLSNLTRVAAGANFTLAVVPGPAVLRQPTDAVINPGADSTLSAVVAENGPLTLQWQKDGVDLPGQTNTTLTYSNVQHSQFGGYRLRVSNATGTVFSQVARLLAPPIITNQPVAAIVFAGTNVTFEVGAVGSEPLHYRWFTNNSNVLGTNSSLTYSNVSFPRQGDYWAVVSNTVGVVTSVVARLTVTTKPSLSFYGTIVTNFPYDSPFAFSVLASAVSPDSYQWQWNGINIPGATNSLLSAPGARPAAGGTYRCLAIMRAGIVAGPDVTVAVGRADPVNFVGRRVVLDAGDTFGLVRSNRWFRNGIELAGQTNPTLILDSLVSTDAGNYTVTCNYDGGLLRSFEVAQLSVLPAPPAGRIVSWGNASTLPGLPVTAVQDAVAMDMGSSHVLLARADGRLVAWGQNDAIIAPPFKPFEPIISVTAFAGGTGVLGSDGRTYDNYTVTVTNGFVAFALGGGHAVGLRFDGRVFAWGDNSVGQLNVPAGLDRVIAVAAAETHSVALRDDGTVVAWGNAFNGHTNVPAGLAGVRAIACGREHSLALRSNGTVTAWGLNANGQCNVPVGLTDVAYIGAGDTHNLAVRSNGTVIAWGDNSWGQCNVPAGLSNVVAITGGQYTSMVLVGGTQNPAILEHPVGGVRELGEVFIFQVRAWSSAPLSYQWQHNGTNLPSATNTSLTVTNLQLADEGDYTVVVVTSSGMVVSDTATLVVNPAPFLTLPARGRLFAWGSQSMSGIPAGIGEVGAIIAGPASFSSYTIETDGTAQGWNGSFLVTLPETNFVSVVRWYRSSTGDSGYLGLEANGVVRAWSSSLQELAPPEGLRNVVQLVGSGGSASGSAGGSYIAIRSEGTIRHSYAPDFFPTNLTNVVQASAGLFHGALLLANGTVVLSKPIQFTQQTPVPAGLSNVVQVAVGEQHTLALLGDGTVFAWGRTNEGQCSVPVGLSNVTSVAAGAFFSMALRSNGPVVVWGADDQGQKLIPPGLTNVVAIAAGITHCLAIQAGPVLITPPADLNVRPGETGVFQVAAKGKEPLSYQWRFQGDALSGATNSSLSVLASPETEGLYSVIVSNAQGSVAADAMLWLGLPPEILASPEGGIIAVGASKTFMVLASGLAPLRYQWQSNGTNITGATNSTYILSSVTTNRTGLYRVIVTNLFGATFSHESQLSVITAPSFLVQPVSQTRAVGETASFNVATSGGQPQTYQWRINASPLPGETNASLVITNVATNQAGAYSVRVSNIVAAITSTNAMLTVVAAAPQFVSTPSDQAASFGAEVRWNVVATGAAPLAYQWHFNGAALPNGTTNLLVIAHADTNHSGAYRVVVSNAFNSITSPPAQLTLRIPPNVVIWGTNDLVKSIPPNLTNAVAVSASEHVLALREDGTVAAWGLNGDGQATVPAGLTNVIAVAAGGRHSLALRSDGRVFAWGRNTLGETNVPVGLTNAMAIAAGSSHNLAIRSNGTLAGWGYDVYSQATPPVGLSNVIGITANGQSSQALKSDGTIVGWGNGYFPPAGLSNVVKVMGRARMLALRSDGRVVGWEWLSGGTVEGPPGIVAADSYVVPYQQGNVTYLESHELGLLTNGTVAIWGTNRGGIFNPPAGLSNVMSVSAGYFFNAAVVGGPTIIRQPQDTNSGVGTIVSFAVQADSRSPLRYQWRFNGTNLPGATNTNLTLPPLVPAHSGQYSVMVSSTTGVLASRTATLLVLSDVPYVLSQPASRSVLEGAPVSFEVAAVGAPPLAYQWLHNGAMMNNATQSVLALPATTAGDAGIYAVRVSNTHGDVLSAEVMLTLSVLDVIVDNSSATVTGPWQASSNPNQIGTNHLLIAPGVGANQVRFAPNLPRGGSYRVSSRYFSQSQPLLTPALHIVNHAQGMSVVMPTALTGWSLLGTFNFAIGNSSSVIVLDSFPNVSALGIADAVSFSYQPAPPTIALQPKSTNVVEDTDLMLSVVATGAPPLAYQWQLNRTNLPGLTSTASLLLPSMKRSQAGAYRVLVSNTDGSVCSSEAQVNVVAPPLQFQFQDRRLVLQWSGEATLQMATNAAGPYADLPGILSPATFDPTQSELFFRLKR